MTYILREFQALRDREIIASNILSFDTSQQIPYHGNVPLSPDLTSSVVTRQLLSKAKGRESDSWM